MSFFNVLVRDGLFRSSMGSSVVLMLFHFPVSFNECARWCAFCAPTVCKAAQCRNLKLDYVCFDVVTYPFDLVLCFAEYCFT